MRKIQYLMAITIGWRSQQSWRGCDSCCRDHRLSTDEGGLDETRVLYQLVTILETNRSLPSGAKGCHLETQLTGSNEYSKDTAAYR